MRPWPVTEVGAGRTGPSHGLLTSPWRRPATSTETPRSLAASEAVPDVLAALVRAGAAVDSVNALRQSALARSAQAGHVENVEVLLAAGADPGLVEAHGLGPAAWARCEGWDAVAALLESFVSSVAA